MGGTRSFTKGFVVKATEVQITETSKVTVPAFTEADIKRESNGLSYCKFSLADNKIVMGYVSNDKLLVDLADRCPSAVITAKRSLQAGSNVTPII